MIQLFFITTILLYGLLMAGFAYCGAKIYRLPHLPKRWGFYLSSPYFAFAGYLLAFLITAPFAAKPCSIVLWTAIVRLLFLLGLAAGITLPSLFFLNWINGAGNFADAKEKE